MSELSKLGTRIEIVRFALASPIVVDGEGIIIAGHYRLLAARKLNLTEVPVAVLDGLREIKDPAAKRREREKDNASTH